MAFRLKAIEKMTYYRLEKELRRIRIAMATTDTFNDTLGNY